MTSITRKKAEERDRISAYWGRYAQTLPITELRDLVLWLVRKLSAQMTLGQLEEWRGKLGERGLDEETHLPPYYVAISSNGPVGIHFLDTTGCYATLCAMDGDDPDPSVNQKIVPVPRGGRVDCRQCIAIYDAVQGYTEDDIDRER
ncbi:MAG: hypothetical protein ABIG63_07040 [Chloroflexota bacterium]